MIYPAHYSKPSIIIHNNYTWQSELDFVRVETRFVRVQNALPAAESEGDWSYFVRVQKHVENTRF